MSFPNLSALAVRERAVTLFFLILALLAGAYAFASLGRAEDPDFTVRVMMVSAAWPGASPEEIQESVVDPLEKRIQEVDDLYRIETTIRPGRADLKVEFEDTVPGEAITERFYQVRRRMQDAAPSLPEGVMGPMINEDFGDVYFSLAALTAPGMPMRELLREAEGVRDRLQRVEGVNKAEVLGERQERMHVDFDLARLQSLGISPEAVFSAIQAHNRLLPAGRIDTLGPRLYLRLTNDLSDPEALADVPIRIGERLIRLGDIAEISRGYEDPPSYLVRAFGEESLLLGVVMEQGVNGLEFGDRLDAFWRQERKRLPLGMSLEVMTNQADAIAGAVNLFQVKFLVAVLVVMLVTMLAVGLRAGIVVGIAIPITLALTFVTMLAMGINLDRVTLGALIIALGLLVDDAIIALEMMIVKMEAGWNRLDAATHAWNVTAAPMLFGTLVTVAGFVPIGFAQSAVGEYTGNIFWVLCVSLLLSWIVAVVFTPYLGVKLLPEQKAAHGQREAYQSRGYRRLRGIISGCVRYRKSVVALTVVLLVAAAAGLAGPVEKQFFPSSDRPEVLVSVYHPQGTAIGATDATTRRLETLIGEAKGVASLSAYVGAGAPRFFISANPEQPNPAFAKLIAVTEGGEARERLIEKLNEHIAAGDFPEARVRVQKLLYGPPVDWPVSFRVLGDDPDRLREIGHQVREIMADHAAIRDPHLEWNERVPRLHLAIDHHRLQLVGLTPDEVARQLQFQLDGMTITELRDGIRLVPAVGRGAQTDTVDLQSLEILNREGRRIPLAQLGELETVFEEPVIRRIDRQPFLAVNAEIEGAQPNDVTQEVWQALGDLRERLPTGYQLQIGGSVEQSTKAEASIQALQPLMVVLMLIFIMLQMRSFAGTFIVIATAPLGLIGAVAALLLFNQPFGFVATLGLIGLAGILMRNTLILTQQVADNVRSEMTMRDAVVEAAVQRARPVVLTALAAIFAFIPLTLDSFWGPLAYVLIGGVAVGTLITLFFVPALYALGYRIAPHTDKAR
ncbi:MULTISPECIES: efflux RND transporter permease subunit [unclassified Halomonas]|uniref:efflux RND transporter permease subunit n=1 Tax=unclassified Halomonas TaxID=2609666 RepID=UPI0028860127|nr:MULTISPECIES: efflux RND transporter permease subunit [unclassified Halomonas]MDT0499513.1 efflux RND transporter permease subunit [Halomonas sp. PAR7]MDT0510670.1 efflux RND transporter permease subunit [Halomonas sp. LES1]MDT0592317.1 efflux RND transporter permease subunit [Halomonas sp. PAR8]